MPRPTFFLQPANGLCNRMRAIMYWSAFADAINRDFCIVWNPGQGFDDTPYQDLFELPEHWRLLENTPLALAAEKSLDLNLWIFPDGKARRKGHQLPPVSDFGYGGEFSEVDIRQSASAGSQASDYATTVKSNSFLSALVHIMKPSADILWHVEELRSQFTSKTIGLHIRGNDALSPRNKNSIHYDSLSGLEKWHRSVKSAPSDTNFFLSTDSEAIEQEFLESYGDRIITQSHKEFFETETWEEKPGQASALIDLYCLGLTKELVGTTWSSFSELAKLYIQYHASLAEKNFPVSVPSAN